jgi:hypothetical protein
MTDDVDITRGSGNVSRDLGHPHADRQQLRALVAAADLSRTRNASTSRLTIDRLMTILASFGQEVNVTVHVNPRRTPTPLDLGP